MDFGGRHKLGVVVIGRNEGNRLIACLQSIDPMTYAVVYVDSGSSDGSIAAATHLAAKVVKLDLATPFTAARARNAGFAALRAANPGLELVQFVDGDCTLARHWLTRARAFLEARPDVAAVCGRRREKHPSASIYNALCDLEWNTPTGEASACGGDALMRAEALVEIGGYRPDLIAGEEPELCLRLRGRGWRIWRLDEEMSEHDAAMSRFSQWWQRAVRCGHAYGEVTWLHRNSKLSIWKVNTVRALLWGGAFPLMILLGALISRFLLLAFLIYFVQIARMAVRSGASERIHWIGAGLVMVAKSAECLGILIFFSSLIHKRKTTLIEYK